MRQFLPYAALVAAVAIAIRLSVFFATGAADDPYLMVESAQHVYYAGDYADLAHGGTTALLVDLEFPDGAPRAEDTMFSYWLYGRSYGLLRRWWPAFPFTLQRYCQYLTIIWSALPPVFLYLLLQLRGARLPALLLALTAATSLPLVERSCGTTFYHEHLVLVFISAHAFLSYHLLGRGTKHAAYIAAVCLALALVGWKAARFWWTLHTLILLTWWLLRRGADDPRPRLRLLLLAQNAAALLAIAVTPHLREDRLFFSPLFWGTAAWGLLLCLPPRRGRWLPVAGAVLAAAAAALFPAPATYSHVWAVVAAQLQHGFSKPADPALLTPLARLYWVPPYQHASLLRFINDLGLLTLCGLGAALYTARRWWRHRDDTALLLLLAALATGTAYAFFFKTVTFFLPHLLLLFGYAAAALPPRRAAAAALLLLVVTAGTTLLRERSPLVQALIAAGLTGEPVTPAGSVAERNELIGWFAARPQPQAVIAHYGIGCALLAYTRHPIVMQSYFETARVRDRILAFADALFAEEATFTAFADRLRAPLFVCSADLALATDGGSYRYLAAALDRNATFADTCQFAPDMLRDWRLVWQNGFYRVFARRSSDSDTPAVLSDLPPLWRADLFAAYHGDRDAFLRDGMAATRAWQAARLLAAAPATAGNAAALRRQAAARYPRFAAALTE